MDNVSNRIQWGRIQWGQVQYFRLCPRRSRENFAAVIRVLGKSPIKRHDLEAGHLRERRKVGVVPDIGGKRVVLRIRPLRGLTLTSRRCILFVHEFPNPVVIQRDASGPPRDASGPPRFHERHLDDLSSGRDMNHRPGSARNRNPSAFGQSGIAVENDNAVSYVAKSVMQSLSRDEGGRASPIQAGRI
jgi:hypothetical protein